MFKRILFSIVILGCFGLSGVQAQSATSGAKTTLTVMRWGSSDEEASFQKLFAAFSKENPDIAVKAVFSPWNNYWDNLNISLAGDSIADLVGMTTYMGSKYYIDRFEDLRPYMAKASIKFADMVPGIQEWVSDKSGKIYALPSDLAIWCLTYNKDIFDQLKIPYPSNEKPMTWDQFLAIAKKATKKNGNSFDMVGYNDVNDNAGRMNFFTSTYGGDMFESLVGPKKITIDTPAGRRAVDLISKLGGVMPPVAEWGKAWEGGLLNKKAAMASNGPWDFANYGKSGIKFGVAPLPEGVPGAKVRGLANTWMMPKSAKNKEAGWRLMQWIASPTGQKYISSLGLGLPIYESLLDSSEFKGQYKGLDLTAYKYMLKHFSPVALLPSDTFNIFIFDQYKNLMEGKISEDAFVTKAKTEGQKILDEMNSAK